MQRAELFPTVAARASNTASDVRGGMSTTHSYTAQLAMSSYELDFFGRVRNLTEQALQSYLQSEDAQRTAQGSLIAEVAMAWLTLSADRAQLTLQEETLKSQEESFRLVEESYKYGAASQLDYEQARTTVAAARAQIASYVRAVAQDRNALELLVGAKVDEALLPETLVLDSTLPASMPDGVPSEVLLNRPDIMSAERGMISANANIGVARAAFFPSISLTAAAGSTGGAMHLSDLLPRARASGISRRAFRFRSSRAAPTSLICVPRKRRSRLPQQPTKSRFKRLSVKSRMHSPRKVRLSVSLPPAATTQKLPDAPMSCLIPAISTVRLHIRRCLMRSAPKYRPISS